MSGDRPSVRVRPARPQDYEAVRSLVPDLWGGVDYLPIKFLTYFSDPQAHPFVGEVDGKVVAFANYYIVDDGQTAVATGGRTLARYQGKGVSAKVNAASLGAARRTYPNLRTEARTVIDSDFYDQYRKPNPKGVFFSYERALLQYLTTTRKLLQLFQSLENCHQAATGTITRQVTDKADLKSLSRQLLRTNLFSEGTILIYNSYLPLKVTLDNLELACNTTNVVASHDRSTERCTGVSFGSCLQVRRGPSLALYLHVTTVNDLFEHLKLQLQYHSQVLSHCKGDANLELNFPQTLPKDEVKGRLFPSLGVNSIQNDIPRETVLCVVRPLPTAKPKL